MLLSGILRRENIDPCAIRFVGDFFTEEATNLFKGGFGDFFVGRQPASTLMARNGIGSVVADFADAGEIPWSIFYAKPEFLNRSDNVAGRFAKAIKRALVWILDHEPEDAPGVFQKYFAQYSPELVAESVRSCRARGMWVRSVRISEPGLMRWQEMIVREGRLIDAPMSYSEIVDSRAAVWAEQQFG